MESAPISATALLEPKYLQKRRMTQQEAGLALPPGPGGFIFAMVVTIVVAHIMLDLGFIGVNQLYEGFIEQNIGKIIAASGLVATVLAFLFSVKLFK